MWLCGASVCSVFHFQKMSRFLGSTVCMIACNAFKGRLRQTNLILNATDDLWATRAHETRWICGNWSVCGNPLQGGQHMLDVMAAQSSVKTAVGQAGAEHCGQAPPSVSTKTILMVFGHVEEDCLYVVCPWVCVLKTSSPKRLGEKHTSGTQMITQLIPHLLFCNWFARNRHFSARMNAVQLPCCDYGWLMQVSASIFLLWSWSFQLTSVGSPRRLHCFRTAKCNMHCHFE